ncbi:hypothetical protein ULMA_08760 [Patiriisocius marinus]|uniref:Uncharacterized protein n=1 Tax=Patiriisocius marinus TaxID=1397112 RepID=A0A5J4IYP8_9FLAO|nr:hypothetical protein ULMA_08760 [Patiriisocius marinus]
MNVTNRKIINLAIAAIVFLFVGSELIIANKTDGTYEINQIRPWFTLLIACLFYVFAKQISERSKK